MSSFAASPGYLAAPRPRAARPTRTAQRGPRPAVSAVRLTRRGRLVLTLLFLGLVLAAFTVFGTTSAATGEAGQPVPTRTVVVEEGDTLWGIAATAAEPGQVREMVHRIEELNALPGAGVYVGQRIAVPAE